MGIRRNLFFFLNRLLKAEIVRVFSLTGLATFVKMLTGFVSIKIVAGIIGPSGIALLGQLNNFVTIIVNVASAGVNNGITKYVAEYKEQEEIVKSYISTAARLVIVFSVVIGLFLITFSNEISETIMLSKQYGYVFIIFGFTVIFYGFNALLISVVNGFKEFKKYVSISISGSIVGLVFTILLALLLHLKGALIGVVTFQSIMLFFTLFYIRKTPWLRWFFFVKKIDIKYVKNLLGFAIMTFTTIALVPVSQMVLRGYVIKEISLVEAGWWEGMNRISGMYLNIITMSFSIYYLPQLSEALDRISLRKEIIKAYKMIIPLMIVGVIVIYIFRVFIIKILFTPDFFPMENLFIWQLLGDFFKISSWLLSFVMIAKGMVKQYIITEVIFTSLFIVLAFILLKNNGVIGITQAYFFNYVIYAVVMYFLFRNKILVEKQ